MSDAILPIAIFTIVYIAVSLEVVNKSVAALSGVMALIICRIINLEEAISFVNFETIMLLMGMMVIVSQLKASGIFSVMSVKIAEFTGGRPLAILLLFSLVTSFMSAILDNVTTVLIVIPIVVELTVGMGLNPRLYCISQAIISNIGGTATLIGDPPNIIIGSTVGLSFNQFLTNLFLPIGVIFVVSLFYIWARNREDIKPIHSNLIKLYSVQLLLQKIKLEFLNIKQDRRLTIKGIICLVGAILLFMAERSIHLSPGVIAVTAAMVLFIISRNDIATTLEEVEWDTLLFFAGLFILVGVLEKEGIIEWIAHSIFLRLGDNPYIMVVTVIWVSAIISGFLDNIPFTVAMIPVVEIMLQKTPIPNNILWWALALGACLGGNLTYIGASANIVAVGMSKRLGYKITFFEFMKTGVPITIISLIISTIYLMVYLKLSL